MIVFKIQFSYKGKDIEASVHELETPPKHWFITVDDESLPIEFLSAYYTINYNYTKAEYDWDFLDFDTYHSFMNSLGQSLINYVKQYGWNSVNV